MKDLEQPPPLDEMADTPPELLEVMRALGREAPSRAALERVARQLGPILDAAPGMPVPTALNTGTLGKFMVARVVVALLAVGGTVYWLQSPRSAPPATSSSPAPVAPVAPAPWGASAESVAAATPEPVGGMVAQPVRAVAGVPTAAHAPRPRSHKARARGRAPVRAALVQGGAAPLVTAPVSVAESPVATAKPVAPPAAQPTKERELAPPAAPGPDEFALLWQARQRLASDPAGALALLQTHGTRFADGQLAPEREVLAVEALRALGRKDEAERRLQAFRKRYPGSIHLRRLQQAASSRDR